MEPLFINIQQKFEDCFRDIGLKRRDPQLFETGDTNAEGKSWFVIAAGITDSEAQDFFENQPKRIERAGLPLTYQSYKNSPSPCEIQLLFVLRPWSSAESNPFGSQGKLVTPFDWDSDELCWVEIRQAYVRIYHIPGNSNNVNNLRWEWDTKYSFDEPQEPWIRNWKKTCGFNPAHPPSHLHINSSDLPIDGRPEPEDELRLALGRPNPIALILSIATWLKALKSN